MTNVNSKYRHRFHIEMKKKQKKQDSKQCLLDTPSTVMVNKENY